MTTEDKATKQHIVDTAASICDQKGYDAVTPARVAVAAGVSRQLVYHYYTADELSIEALKAAISFGSVIAIATAPKELVDSLKN